MLLTAREVAELTGRERRPAADRAACVDLASRRATAD